MAAELYIAVLISIIGSASAGCAWPPRPAHGNYTLIRRGRSRFSQTPIPEDGVLRYSCASNYLIQNRGLRRCHRSMLSGPDEMCLVKKCPALDLPINMLIDLEADGAVLTKAMFRCAVGYHLVGNKKMKCRLNQRWRGNLPVCVASVSCGDPGMAPSISREGDCCYEGDTSTYSCPSDQELIGSSSITCQNNGTWSASAPYCNETAVCSALPSTVDNGVVTTSRQVNGFMWLGDNVTVTCNTGYYISRNDDNDENSGNFGDDDDDDNNYDSAYSMHRDSKTVKCGDDGIWSGALPSCEEWRCSFRDEIFRGGRRPDNVTSLTHGQAVEYYCDAGYELIGEKHAVCNGITFQPESFTPPRCERVRCPEIVDLENGFISGSSFDLHDRLNFSCSDGFDRLGPASRTCQETRRWSGVMVTCESRLSGQGVQNDCPDPGIPAGATKEGSSYRIGDRVNYRCRRNEYNFVGEATLECMPSGEWNFAPPVCEDIHTFETAQEIAEKLTPSWDLLMYETSSSKVGSRERRRGRIAHMLGSGLDLYFLIDTSGSMTRDAFSSMTQLITKLVTKVGIGEAWETDKTRIGLVSFSNNITRLLLPTDKGVKTIDDVMGRLKTAKHDKGATCLACALVELRTDIIPTVKMKRLDSKIAVVILTDGVANVGSDPKNEATKLKSDNIGVEIFTIGVSREVNRALLRNVSSDDSNGHQHMFVLKDFMHMDVLVSLLTSGAKDYSSCGTTTSTQKKGRIAGGKEAVKGKWRWMAALYMPDKNTVTREILNDKRLHYIFKCGASLISDSWVLTAAHCVWKKDDDTQIHMQRKPHEVYVKLGTTNLEEPKQIREVNWIKCHDDYIPGNDDYDNDIALLHLKSAVTPDPYVGFICLPDDDGVDENQLKDRMTVTGWGKRDNNGTNTVTDLMEVSLPYTHDTEACQNLTRDTSTHQFCLGNGKVNKNTDTVNDACPGDSGGPAMRELTVEGVTREKKWVQGGIVSSGSTEHCGIADNIGVYTTLSSYTRWIRRTINDFERDR